MKRITTILFILLSVVAFANNSFDPTKNYQLNNAKAYIGEILVVRNMPSNYNASHSYRWFKDFSFDETNDSEYSMWTNYMFEAGSVEDGTINGTNKKHIEGRMFKVEDVYLMSNREYVWVMELSDFYTHEKVKYIYHGDQKFYNDFQTFPFYTVKHLKYLYNNLIGKEVVYGTRPLANTFPEHNLYYRNTYNVDYFTNENINYNKSYASGIVEDIIIDSVYQEIGLIVKHNGHKVLVSYTLHYEENPYAYNAGTRVFTKSQWNMLVNKYGESHMSNIMSGIATDTMSDEEKLMACGRKAVKKANSSSSSLDMIAKVAKLFY